MDKDRIRDAFNVERFKFYKGLEKKYPYKEKMLDLAGKVFQIVDIPREYIVGIRPEEDGDIMYLPTWCI